MKKLYESKHHGARSEETTIVRADADRAEGNTLDLWRTRHTSDSPTPFSQ